MIQNVQFNLETYNEHDEPVVWDVSCRVVVEHDPYGTGDSTTEYEVDNITIVGEQGEISEHDIHPRQHDKLCDKAIAVFKGE